MKSLDRLDVLRQIDEAFAGARKPQTEDELAPPSIEAPYAIEHFLGKSQSAVETEHFPASLYMEDFTYMTDEAVRYYLPAVLRIMLAKTSNDELWIFLHGFLRTVKGKYPASSLTTLDDRQRKAIADWAEHLAGEWEAQEWMSEFFAEAIELAQLYRVDR